MTFVTLKRQDGLYFEKECNSEYLSTIGHVITNLGTSSDWLVKELSDPTVGGFSTNSYHLMIKDNKVLIEPLYVEDPAEWRIEVDKGTLIRLAAEWQELVDKKAEEITIMQEDGEIKMIGKLPESS